MDDERLIFLHHCDGLSWKHIKNILTADPELVDIFKMDIISLMKSFGLSEKAASRLYSFMNHKNSTYIMNVLKKNSISAIPFFHTDYPPSLRTIFDPPWVLYGKGDWSTLKQDKILSVVGTRNPSSEGLGSLSKVLSPLLKKKWVVVSGLARGIDTYAHRLCLENGTRTAAVLGSGIKCVYPAENNTLAEQISSQGIVVSEFPPFVQPKRWHFPLRNRIISGLGKATLVAEARRKSGSLITADQALEQGRDVYAIPGSILEDCAAGTNFLIQNGAKLVMCAEDIAAEWT
ncbi:DNA-processing protein DprA [Fictibacillus phosphorivorans]|uniref:DNA-processing protein DprA n=1 Tax=Fictibacillus phosphorivorans TaxID=1221500 RepID=UPI00203DD5F1|nr:DNA-processing protein DprA [Fictibacillus phosphorivorans]MCM3717172.1 DNA-processing protein DprA [Fictibacillus phosphorivorans]MCM3774859.1 DNA-processing protein DprA [Fictibacillus phosphorivorans]